MRLHKGICQQFGITVLQENEYLSSIYQVSRAGVINYICIWVSFLLKETLGAELSNTL